MITPFIDFSGDNPSDVMLSTLEQETNRLDHDYGVLAPLTIVKFGILNIDLRTQNFLADPDGAQFPIPHGLGYAPIFQMYMYFPGIKSMFPMPSIGSTGPDLPGNPTLHFDNQLYAYADDINVYGCWHGHAQTWMQSFYYVIYNNPIVTSY